MKVTMQMTLDGLIRALRFKEHELAERLDSGGRGSTADAGRAGSARKDPDQRTSGEMRR